MAGRTFKLAIAALLLAGAPVAPAMAADSAGAVSIYYLANPQQKIWLRDAGTIAGAHKLAEVLRRGQLDGLMDGPARAARVETAIAQAANGAPADAAAAERLLSNAWVDYLTALAVAPPEISYGDKALLPKPPIVGAVLSAAARAPSLAQHIAAVAAVNPIYAELRDAEWAAMQAAGTATPDPRVMANLARARVLPGKGRAIVVDTATQRLWMLEDGRVADSMKVVVGKKITPTPMLAGTIYYATFNPYWNIPSDVIKRTVAPLVIKRGAKYLASARYEVASDWTDQATVVPPSEVDWKAVAAGDKQVRMRQLPGTANMMGKIKFGFVNDYGIYLHDTPHKEFFAKNPRNYSLGCVRVEDAHRLGTWLLGRDAVAPSDLPEQHVTLSQAVPVYVTYLTAHVDNGAVAFANDVYGRDPAAAVNPIAAPTAVASATAPAAPAAVASATAPDAAVMDAAPTPVPAATTAVASTPAPAAASPVASTPAAIPAATTTSVATATPAVAAQDATKSQ
jgi:murein L,D-transpeptidase YcbB/YkuD